MMTKLRSARSAGVLLHPTSLPSEYGIGDLGPSAYRWVDALATASQSWWQVLPLGPTGYGDSPYQSFSAFAGNPYLVSPRLLCQDGLLHEHDLTGVHFPAERVDYGPVIQFKIQLLAKAWENFQRGAGLGLRDPFEHFCASQADWLDDYALFMALKDAHQGKSWYHWEPALVRREPAALDNARQKLTPSLGLHKFRQFLFFRQWKHLKNYAHDKGIKLIGDIPIFVASDSADVWAHAELFFLNELRQPTVVAGVPPDYFSPTGQLWGNPLYNWQAMKEQGYAWWVARLKATLEQVDLIRLDHFRGFEAYWEVPASMTTAEFGHWVKGPGADLFQKLKQSLGSLPLIAEDLGLITPEVEQLRDALGLPGMKILHFAFDGDPHARFLPHNYEPNTVAYTGTHDNDTSLGWYKNLPERSAHFYRCYVGRPGTDVPWDMIRLAWASVSDWAVAPLQDVLGLGSEGRMNFPGRPAGNWSWRFRWEQLTPDLLERLRELTWLYSRA